jgi:hypothetical protein
MPYTHHSVHHSRGQSTAKVSTMVDKPSSEYHLSAGSMATPLRYEVLDRCVERAVPCAMVTYLATALPPRHASLTRAGSMAR